MTKNYCKNFERIMEKCLTLQLFFDGCINMQKYSRVYIFAF